MIENPSSIQMDEDGKQLLEKELALLDLIANDGKINQYAAGCIPAHWHKELEIFVLLEGRVLVSVGECTYEFEAGDGCFINTEVIHCFSAISKSPCDFRSFVFNSDIVAGAPGSLFDTHYVRPLLESGIPFLKFKQGEDDMYFKQFDRAFLACVEEKEGYEFEVRDAFSQILLYIRSKISFTNVKKMPSIQETRLKEMIIWIHNHLEESITVLQIAKVVNICPRECQRIFNQYLHYSPIEYVQRKRILTAAKQLIETDEEITQIALQCGFSSPSYFSKQFKLLIGNTPREYRKNRK